MGRSYGLGDDVYESELDAELSMLEDDFESVDDAAGVPDYMPAAPSQVYLNIWVGNRSLPLICNSF